MKELWSNAPLFIILIVQFFAIEFYALFNKKRGDSWSEVLRYIFGFSKRAGDIQSTGMKVRRLSFYGLAAWFVLHISGVA